MSTSITNIMLKEHERIKKNLDEFEQELNKDLKKSIKIFEIFKWTLEKHFFIEEKAIFTFIDTNEFPDILTLGEQHEEILSIIKNIDEDLEEGIKPKINDLKVVLLKHAEFEDEVFYPELDE
jgi:hypothetical protein